MAFSDPVKEEKKHMQYDYIVVGGGSSGCVVAGRLVREYQARVLLIEAGGADTSPFVTMPAGYTKLLGSRTKLLTRYETVPQPGLNGRVITIDQATVIGGGSSINAMTYTRGARADYDGWNELLGGNAGWSWNDILPNFIKQEGNQRFGPPYHGVDGPLKVSDPHHPSTPSSRSFLHSMLRLGVPFNHDINDGDLAGMGTVQSTIYRGRRCSASAAFLASVKDDPKLTIAKKSLVLRILIENGRAVGVEYARNGQPQIYNAGAGQEVVICAGTLSSPKLLMLSGIGNADHLASHGIKPVADVPGVGQNLQDHCDGRIAVSTRENVSYSGEDAGWKMWANGLQYLLFGSGPVSSTGSEVTGFVNSLDPLGPPNVQFYCIGAIYGTAGPSATAGVTLSANLVQPKSRGQLLLRSPNPLDKPVVDPNYLDDPADVAAITGGMRQILRAVESPPFSDLVQRVETPVSLSMSDAEFEHHLRATVSTNWHVVGTCKMAVDSDPLGVVDRKLRVRGVAGLRVMDGSIMPRIVSANTNAPIMAIADRGVDLMMNERCDK